MEEKTLLLDENIKNIYWNPKTIEMLREKWLDGNKLVVWVYWLNTYVKLEDNNLLIEYNLKSN